VADDRKLIQNESGQGLPDRPAENAAVARCIRAYQRAYKTALDEDESKYSAQKAGEEAYLRALPPLSGYENIRDFIACITYSDLTEVISHPKADHFLESAKVALALVRYEPRQPGSASKRLGRPPKSATAEENK